VDDVAVPVTVVVGSDDKMTPAAAGRDVAAGLGGATVRTLAGSGHSMMSECPNEVLDVLIEAFGVEN
jgi:pimeloyl-ACP methyl ester carboxylesterase